MKLIQKWSECKNEFNPKILLLRSHVIKCILCGSTTLYFSILDFGQYRIMCDSVSSCEFHSINTHCVPHIATRWDQLLLKLYDFKVLVKPLYQQTVYRKLKILYQNVLTQPYRSYKPGTTTDYQFTTYLSFLVFWSLVSDFGPARWPDVWRPREFLSKILGWCCRSFFLLD